MAGTKSSTGTQVYEIDGTSNKKYENASIPLAQGANTVKIELARKTNRNVYYFDYIKFTPVSEELPFAVSGVEDNTFDPSCISVMFNKPVTSAEGIAVTAQHGTPIVAVDADNTNKVKITGVAGRVSITVPDTFTGGSGEVISKAYTAEVFAYPITSFEINSNGQQTYDSSYRKVTVYFGASAGMWSAASADRKIKVIIALYDGDKMVAVNQKDFYLPNADTHISLQHDEGVKFTEAKAFAFLEIDGNLIPVAKPVTRTAKELGAVFN